MAVAVWRLVHATPIFIAGRGRHDSTPSWKGVGRVIVLFFGVPCIGCLSRTNRPRASSFQLLREGRRVRTRTSLTKVGALDGEFLLSRKTQVFCPPWSWCSKLVAAQRPAYSAWRRHDGYPLCQGCFADDTALAVDFATWSAPVRGPCVSTLPKT